MSAATASVLPPSPVRSPPQRSIALKKPLWAGPKDVVRKLRLERTSTIASVFDSGEYSDVVISNDGDEYNVHRAIVCPQSSVLESLLRNVPGEAQPSIIILPREDPTAFRHMVAYFYYLDYDAIPEDKASGHECVHHAKMYTLADRYEIAGLRKLALARFQDASGTGLWDKASLLAVAREAYEFDRTPPGRRELQDAVVQVFSQHKDELCQPGWKTDLKHMGELLYDLLVWENSREPKEVEPEVSFETPSDTCSGALQEAEAAPALEPKPEAPVEAPAEILVEDEPVPEPEAKLEDEPEPEPAEAEPLAYPEIEPEVGPGSELDDLWGFSSSKKVRTKKAKKKKAGGFLTEPPPETEPPLEPGLFD